jgi:hypothetical protein
VKGLWQRLVARGRKDEAAFLADEATLSSGERAIVNEGYEGVQADEFVEEHLGGVDRDRLLEDDRPPAGDP